MEEASTSLSDGVDRSTEVAKSTDPVIDVGNLLIDDLDPIPKGKGSKQLQRIARDNVQLLINEVWKLPTERVEDALVAKLPAPVTRLPREKPIPKPVAPSRWQQYAQTKGIQPRAKTNKVWDEPSQSWKPRWGYRRAKDDTKDWMLEIPDQGDPYKDYFGERKQAKQERRGKNELQRLKNITRMNPNNANATPLGVGLAENKSAQQLSHQLARAKTATASVGKFTRTLNEERPPKNKAKKRQFAPNEMGGKDEKDKQLDILRRLDSKRPKIDVERAISNEQKSAESEAPGKGGNMKRRRGTSSVHRQQFWENKQKGKPPPQKKFSRKNRKS